MYRISVTSGNTLIESHIPDYRQPLHYTNSSLAYSCWQPIHTSASRPPSIALEDDQWADESEFVFCPTDAYSELVDHLAGAQSSHHLLTNNLSTLEPTESTPPPELPIAGKIISTGLESVIENVAASLTRAGRKASNRTVRATTLSTSATTPKVGHSHVIPNSRVGENSTEPGLNTFTGSVYVDYIYSSANGSSPSGSAATVLFEPGARTFWHRHEGGQILRVLAGTGWIADPGVPPRRIYTGDTIWCEANTTHWHGADEGSYLVHLAISLGGTEWLGEVEV
ncbi:RmlC-like cupin domain-containing protein [Aspergillus karnatakaensis]|uniref:cupin domain-containing protein n=1 Tax=Aspergillus karnatakaensis TaxID=1810916 RepID=UPI003CCE250D